MSEGQSSGTATLRIPVAFTINVHHRSVVMDGDRVNVSCTTAARVIAVSKNGKLSPHSDGQQCLRVGELGEEEKERRRCCQWLPGTATEEVSGCCQRRAAVGSWLMRLLRPCTTCTAWQLMVDMPSQSAARWYDELHRCDDMNPRRRTEAREELSGGKS